MHAAVRFSYRDGTKLATASAPLVGQVMSDVVHGVPVLRLWPVDWVQSGPWSGKELALLWQPQLCSVLFDSFVFRGLEATTHHPRQWLAQKWLCEVLDPLRARNYERPDLRFGEVTPCDYGEQRQAAE